MCSQALLSSKWDFGPWSPRGPQGFGKCSGVMEARRFQMKATEWLFE